MKTRKHAVFYLNGVRLEVGAEHARMMLADYLRYVRGLTGTKIVCAEGDCGACSVLRLDPSKKNQFIPINSCITTVAQMDGSSIVTVEALQKDAETLSAVQQSMVSCHGSQCGFCTPGFIVAITGALEARKEGLTPQEAKNACTGNLCRCTGYQPIIDAATLVDLSQREPVIGRYFSKQQESELKKARATSLFLENEKFTLFAPTSLRAAAQYLNKNKTARMIGAGTDLGVVSNKGKLKLDQLVSLHLVRELNVLKKSKSAKGTVVTVGARVTLSELRQFLKPLVPEFAKFLDIFASPQIKNVATLVGNVGNASPIADTPPFLLASDAVVTLVGVKGTRKVKLDQFYLGYRKTALKPGEFISAIQFLVPQKTEKLSLYKSSQRKDLDISAVNAAFKLSLKKGKVEDVRLALGGVAATPVRLKKTENYLRGQVLNAETLKEAVLQIQSEIKPLSDVRGSSAFRRILVENFFQQFVRELG